MKRIFLLICCVCLSCFTLSACDNSKAESTVTYTFSVNIDEKTLEVGDFFQIQAAYGDKKLTYSSDNQSVVTVSESGKLLAIDGGVAYITISVEGSTEKYICEITVVNPQYSLSFVDEGEYTVAVNAAKVLRVISLKDGKEYNDTFEFTVNSENASVEWTDSECVFKATAVGAYTVTANSSKGAVATIIVNVISE